MPNVANFCLSKYTCLTLRGIINHKLYYKINQIEINPTEAFRIEHAATFQIVNKY